MQEYPQADYDFSKDAITKFEEMVGASTELYFDVHQIENIVDYYVENSWIERAEHALKIGLKQHPQSCALQIKQATVLIEKGVTDEAHSILLPLSQIESSNPEIFLNMAWISLRQKNIDKSVSYYSKAVEIGLDEEEEALFEIGYNLNIEGAYKEALPFLELAVSKYCDNENILFELAFAYDKIEEYQKSIAVYEHLLELNPFSENGWYNLGILYNRIEDFHKAIEAYNFTHAINPEHAEAYFNMGNSFAQINEYEEALDHYFEYASFGRDNIITYTYIGDCYERLNKFTNAIKYYRKSTRLDPGNSEAWFGLGNCFFEEKKYSESFAAFEEALSLDNSNSDYWFSFGRTCQKIDMEIEAMQCFQKALNLSTDGTAAWIDFHKACKNIESYQAKDFVCQELKKDDINPSLHYLAAIVFFENDDFSLAVEHLIKAHHQHPKDLEMVLDSCPELLKEPQIANLLNKTKRK